VDVLSTVHGSTVNLSWRITYAGAPPNGVRLVARVGGQVVAQQDMPLVERVTFHGVPAGRYDVTLAALYNGAAGPESVPVPVTAGEAVTCEPPQPPSRLRAMQSGAGQVTALWLPPASGSAITDYELRVNGSFVGALPMADRQIVASAPPGAYRLSVVARNACGVSVPSTARTVVVP
jgi:hypothetical protein